MSLTHLPSVQKLSLRVWRVLGLNPGNYTLQGTNTYLVGTGRNRILIDTGEADRDDYCSLLVDTLHKLEAKITKIIITHWHHDHLGGLPNVLKCVCQGQNPLVLKHKLDTNKGLYYPLRQSREGGGGGGVVVNEEGMTYLSDGDTVDTEGATLKVLVTPGHTQDHLSLWLQEEKSIFTGDCILGEGSAVFEHLGTYMTSLHKLLQLHPCTLYPGHGPVVDDGFAKIKEYISHRNTREKQVTDHLESCSGPVTAYQIVQSIYKDIDQSLWLGAENNVILHLEKLHEEGRVHKVKEDSHTSWKLNNNKL